jgi:hypothetical protein
VDEPLQISLIPRWGDKGLKTSRHIQLQPTKKPISLGCHWYKHINKTYVEERLTIIVEDFRYMVTSMIIWHDTKTNPTGYKPRKKFNQIMVYMRESSEPNKETNQEFLYWTGHLFLFAPSCSTSFVCSDALAAALESRSNKDQQ